MQQNHCHQQQQQQQQQHRLLLVGTDESQDLAAPKQKERRIVTWTQEEDDILRQQISIHGTENWTLIASKFNDKTTRQCRRRWYTYLNTDFKKGGWSPEEDMLLCEAQKIFGNRWTEIAKLVSGRTDNAVKNRFNTLCKKRAKREALAKENETVHVNNKRALVDDELRSEGTLDVLAAPLKKTRSPDFPDITTVCDEENRLVNHCVTAGRHYRPISATIAQNAQDVNCLRSWQQFGSTKLIDDDEEKIERAFLKKDDPKIAALIQQAELLSSLALKVNAENTAQSLDSAWKVLQNFLHRNKENVIQNYDILGNDVQDDVVKDLMEELRCGTLDDLKDLVTDIQISDEVSQPSQRNLDLYESPSSSEYSTGSSILFVATDEPIEQNQTVVCTRQWDTGPGLQPIKLREEQGDSMIKPEFPGAHTNEVEKSVPSPNMEDNGIAAALLSATGFESPICVTPLFRSLAETIPSPQFSESERRFLMRTLGIQSPTPSSNMNHSQPPSCRRALVHSL